MTTSDRFHQRRRALRTLSGLPLVAAAIGLPSLVRAAPTYTFKYGNNLPLDHPLNIRGQQAADRVARESGGRLKVMIFPNNQLGGDTDMLTQVRSGGIDMYNAGTMVIATLTPISAITALGFLFSTEQEIWNAVDGRLGDAIRAAFAKVGLYTLPKMWNNGFRQITSSVRPIAQVSDVQGLKIRVPVSPIGISMFKALSAAPVSLQFSEVYSALQTHIVDGQENPLAIVDTAKLYEVQKYCSITNHSWDGYHMVINAASWARLPEDLQTIYVHAFNDGAQQERDDLVKLNSDLGKRLSAKGLAFNTASPDSFRARLRQTGFYAEWKQKFGNEAWSLLESYAGKVA